jgi:hypothetical protein
MPPISRPDFRRRDFIFEFSLPLSVHMPSPSAPPATPMFDRVLQILLALTIVVLVALTVAHSL